MLQNGKIHEKVLASHLRDEEHSHSHTVHAEFCHEINKQFCVAFSGSGVPDDSQSALLLNCHSRPQVYSNETPFLIPQSPPVEFVHNCQDIPRYSPGANDRIPMQFYEPTDISRTKPLFISRYEQISGDKYDGWWLPHGVLEVGRALGLPALESVLQGCLRTLRASHLTVDFNSAVHEMERGTLPNHSQLSYQQVTEPGTVAFALFYKHVEQGTDDFPRRRMNDTQRRHLLHALQRIVVTKNALRIVLWIDLVMGQRNPLSERDWVRNGILPYFTFDVLILKERNDQRRCWLYLENLIASSYSDRKVIADNAELYEKTDEMGTMTPIQEAASKILSGILLDKEAYRDADKEQIRRWAAGLLRQDIVPFKYQELVSGSSWNSRKYDVEGLIAMMRNHSIPREHVEWRNISRLNSTRSWNGLVELVGLPDNETMTDTGQDVKNTLLGMNVRYMFKVFEVAECSRERDRGFGVGYCYRGSRPPRIILCALDGYRNDARTVVLSSCLLDCDTLIDDLGKEFLDALLEVGGVDMNLFEVETSELWRGCDVEEEYRAVWRRDLGLLKASRKRKEVDQDLTDKLSRWPWFSAALEARGVVLGAYVETIQAGNVMWS